MRGEPVLESWGAEGHGGRRRETGGGGQRSMRQRTGGVGQRRGCGQNRARVKDRGHNILGSRRWGAGFTETRGTNPSPRDMETALRRESQTQGPGDQEKAAGHAHR